MKISLRLVLILNFLFFISISKGNGEENSTTLIDTFKRTLTQLNGDSWSSFNLLSVLTSLSTNAGLQNLYQIVQFAILFVIAALVTAAALIISEYWTAKEERHEKEHYDAIKAHYAQNPPHVSGVPYNQGYYKRQYVSNKGKSPKNPNSYLVGQIPNNNEYYTGFNTNPSYNPQAYYQTNNNPLNEEKVVGYANPQYSNANLKNENNEQDFQPEPPRLNDGNNNNTGGIFNSNLYFPQLKKDGGNSHSQFFYKTKL